MHRKFIALIVSAAVAVTGLTAPARADTDDVAKVLFGLTALALIGKAIEDRNDQPTVINRYPTRPVYTQPGRPIYTQPGRPIYVQPAPPRYQPRPLPRQVSKFDLPSSCLRNFSINGRNVQLFGDNCMRSTYAFTNSLPYACQYGFNGDRGRAHVGYEPLCLRERGYRTARF